MKKYLSVIILALPLCICAQVFPAVQDAYVSQYDPTGNYGTVGDLSIYSNLFSYNCICRSLIQFDLASIPPGTSIQHGILNLYMFDQAGTDFDIEVHSVLQPWLETTVTWDNQPIHDTDIVTILPYQNYGWWHFDITGLAQVWIDNPGINHGVKLKFNIEQYLDSLGRVAQFYSRDTTLEHPNLEIITGNVQEDQNGIINIPYLHPNPARGNAMLALRPAISEFYDIYLYDPTGRKIKTVYQGMLSAGSHDLKIDCASLPAGVYMLKIETGEGSLTKPFVVVN